MNNFAAREFYSIVFGGTLLAINAGFINVVTLAGVYSVTVSHLTGNVSRIAISLYQWDITTLSLVSSIIMSFMFGSFLSGFLVGDNKFQLGKGYGVVLLIESAAIFGSFMFLKRELVIGEWCAAFACGLQNALATSYSGAAVRTTHMTGIITDIGNIIGQACRRDSHAEIWRLKVHVPLLFGFLVGGVLGQMAYIHFKENSLLVPCFFIGGMGALYLSLPFIRQAKVALEEAAHLVAGDGRPVVEIRYIGDPSKADMYAKTVNHDVEREIGDFIRTLGDVEGQGGSGGNGPRSTKSAHPKTPTGKKYEPLADVREDEHEVLYSSSPKDSPPGYEADPVKH